MKLEALEECLPAVVPDDHHATSRIIAIPGPHLYSYALKNLRVARLDEEDYESLAVCPVPPVATRMKLNKSFPILP